MKNKTLKIKIIPIILMLTFVAITGCAFADQPAVQTSASGNSVIFHTAVIKFLKAMGGVVLSSVIIFLGLSVYNKFFVYPRLDGNSEDDVLKTPHSTEEALTFFIKKNKLK